MIINLLFDSFLDTSSDSFTMKKYTHDWWRKYRWSSFQTRQFHAYRQYQLIFFLLFTWIDLVELQSNHTHSNNCPHLFKILTDCTCVHLHTIDCTSSKTITHLPQSWKSTNHNLTSFTQSITRFHLIHTPSITTIKTDGFQVNPFCFHSSFFTLNNLLGFTKSPISLDYSHWNCSD